MNTSLIHNNQTGLCNNSENETVTSDSHLHTNKLIHKDQGKTDNIALTTRNAKEGDNTQSCTTQTQESCSENNNTIGNNSESNNHVTSTQSQNNENCQGDNDNVNLSSRNVQKAINRGNVKFLLKQLLIDASHMLTGLCGMYVARNRYVSAISGIIFALPLPLKTLSVLISKLTYFQIFKQLSVDFLIGMICCKNYCEFLMSYVATNTLCKLIQLITTLS